MPPSARGGVAGPPWTESELGVMQPVASQSSSSSEILMLARPAITALLNFLAGAGRTVAILDGSCRGLDSSAPLRELRAGDTNYIDFHPRRSHRRALSLAALARFL